MGTEVGLFTSTSHLVSPQASPLRMPRVSRLPNMTSPLRPLNSTTTSPARASSSKRAESKTPERLQENLAPTPVLLSSSPLKRKLEDAFSSTEKKDIQSPAKRTKIIPPFVDPRDIDESGNLIVVDPQDLIHSHQLGTEVVRKNKTSKQPYTITYIPSEEKTVVHYRQKEEPSAPAAQVPRLGSKTANKLTASRSKLATGGTSNIRPVRIRNNRDGSQYWGVRKINRLSKLDPQSAMSLLRETKLARLLSTEPVNERPFFYFDTEISEAVMVEKYCPGMTLSQHYKLKTVFSTQDYLSILEQVLTQLSHMWKQGLVHGDISMANIHIHRDESGQLHVALRDFGMSETDTEARTQNTSGTYQFMPADFFRSESKKDMALDLYGVGAIIFKLLNWVHSTAFPDFLNYYEVQGKKRWGYIFFDKFHPHCNPEHQPLFTLGQAMLNYSENRNYLQNPEGKQQLLSRVMHYFQQTVLAVKGAAHDEILHGSFIADKSIHVPLVPLLPSITTLRPSNEEQMALPMFLRTYTPPIREKSAIEKSAPPENWEATVTASPQKLNMVFPWETLRPAAPPPMAVASRMSKGS
jgi:serine/threonine protein kinase